MSERKPATAGSTRRRGAAVIALATGFLLGAGVDTQANDAGPDTLWRWADSGESGLYGGTVFFGQGTESNFSEVLRRLFDVDGSGDRIAGISALRRLAWLGPHLSIEVEALYAYHYGRERYHEGGLAAYARWHDFPWNSYVATTAAVGLGPSYTSRYPALERQSRMEDRSRVLNQLNLELTFAAPRRPESQLLLRLQHRSGVFGLFNGVTDGSNFLTLGLRQRF
jgi:hypothetical protein